VLPLLFDLRLISETLLSLRQRSCGAHECVCLSCTSVDEMARAIPRTAGVRPAGDALDRIVVLIVIQVDPRRGVALDIVIVRARVHGQLRRLCRRRGWTEANEEGHSARAASASRSGAPPEHAAHPHRVLTQHVVIRVGHEHVVRLIANNHITCVCAARSKRQNTPAWGAPSACITARTPLRSHSRPRASRACRGAPPAAAPAAPA
jgi:hypothetical protein